MPGTPLFFCSVHSRITCTLASLFFFAIFFKNYLSLLFVSAFISNGKEHQQSTLRSSKAGAKVLLFFELTTFLCKKIIQIYKQHYNSTNYIMHYNTHPVYNWTSFLSNKTLFFQNYPLLTSKKSNNILVGYRYLL